MTVVEGVAVDARDVTEAEIAQFEEKGWVMTPWVGQTNRKTC